MIKQAIYRVPTSVNREKQLILATKKDISLQDVTFKNKYGVPFMATAAVGNLKGKGFALNTAKFNWLLVTDSYGKLVLVPRKKS